MPKEGYQSANHAHYLLTNQREWDDPGSNSKNPPATYVADGFLVVDNHYPTNRAMKKSRIVNGYREGTEIGAIGLSSGNVERTTYRKGTIA